MKTEETCKGTGQRFLWFELIALFFVTPFILVPFRQFMAFKVVPILILLGIGIYFYLKSQTDFHDLNLVRITNMGPHVKGILQVICIGVPGLIILFLPGN